MSSDNWYVAYKGKVYGPYFQAEIIRLFRDGKFHTQETYFCQDGGSEWIPLEQIPWLGSEIMIRPAGLGLAELAEQSIESLSVPKLPVESSRLLRQKAVNPEPLRPEETYPRLRTYLRLLETVNSVFLYVTWIICGILAVLNLANGIPQFVLGCLVLSLIAGLAYLGYLGTYAGIEFVYVILNIERNTRQLVERQPPPSS